MVLKVDKRKNLDQQGCAGQIRYNDKKYVPKQKKCLKDHGFESTRQSERDDALAHLMSRSWAVRVRCSPR